MKQVAIYARVSTEQQEKEKTIESQIAEVREICKRDKIKVVKEYVDDGWSGSTLARPGLDQLRDDAKKGIWEALYVYSADRLGRDHIDQGIVLRELKKEGIQVIFRDRPLTEENKLQSDIESLLAEHEKRQFLERTRRGKLHKARSGKLIHCKPPYGYEFIKDKNGDWQLKINPEEAKVVRLIFNLFCQYQSSFRVARELFDKGIRTKADCVWRALKISEMLQNETYIGNWHYNARMKVEPKKRLSKFYRRVKSSHKVRDKKDWIILKVPAIIDKATFERIQELRQKNFKLYGQTKHIYILGGLLRCKRCGSRLVGLGYSRYRPTKRRYANFSYYRCSNRTKYFPKAQSCNVPSVRKEDLENLIWGTIKNAIQQPKILIQYISHLNEDGDNELLGEERKDLLRKKTEIERKKDKLFELYELDNINKEELSERIGEYAQAEKAVDGTIKEIDLRMTQKANKDVIINNLKEFSKLTKPQLDTFTDQQKKDFLKLVIKEIWHNPENNEFEIIGHIPILEATPKEIKELMELPIQTLMSSPTRSHGRTSRSLKKIRS